MSQHSTGFDISQLPEGNRTGAKKFAIEYQTVSSRLFNIYLC